MELTMQEKLRLINFFEFLLNEEISKPLGEMNSEAVDNYIKILLHLQDKHVELSPEFIDEQVRKIFHKEEIAEPETAKTTKKQINKKKVWLVAACIAILVALFSIVSVANDWNVFDFLSEKFGSVHSAPIEEEQNFNGVSVIMNGKNTNYKSIEDALKEEKIDILYPTVLPGNIKITDIMIYEKNATHRMTYTFSDLNLYSDIAFNKSLTQNIKSDATEIYTHNNITYYICEMPDTSYCQIDFEYMGNSYFFSYTNKEVLIDIVRNLKEINNEY
jgi:hypothetical protein